MSDEYNQAKVQLEKLLKTSDYFNSVITSHRTATAQAMAIMFKALLKHDPTLVEPIAAAINEIDTKTYRSPSVDGDRSLIARELRAEMQRISATVQTPPRPSPQKSNKRE
jgi:hypothetical protein